MRKFPIQSHATEASSLAGGLDSENHPRRSRPLWATTVGASTLALSASVIGFVLPTTTANAATATPAAHAPPGFTVPCYVLARCPKEGPTVLEVGNIEVGDVYSDWVVTGYGYTGGDKYAVQILNVANNHILDKISATANADGTIAAQSPVRYVAPPPPGQLELGQFGWVVKNPLPTCGVTVQATVTDISHTTSEQVTLPTCPPPPPIPK